MWQITGALGMTSQVDARSAVRSVTTFWLFCFWKLWILYICFQKNWPCGTSLVFRTSLVFHRVQERWCWKEATDRLLLFFLWRACKTSKNENNQKPFTVRSHMRSTMMSQCTFLTLSVTSQVTIHVISTSCVPMQIQSVAWKWLPATPVFNVGMEMWWHTGFRNWTVVWCVCDYIRTGETRCIEPKSGHEILLSRGAEPQAGTERSTSAHRGRGVIMGAGCDPFLGFSVTLFSKESVLSWGMLSPVPPPLSTRRVFFLATGLCCVKNSWDVERALRSSEGFRRLSLRLNLGLQGSFKKVPEKRSQRDYHMWQ